MSITSPQLPPDSAIPAEVRTYFTSLLSQNFHLPPKEAEILAQAWKYGTGAQVYRFSIDTYRGIFGAELGTMLYRHHFPRPFDRIAYHFGVKIKSNKNSRGRKPDTKAKVPGQTNLFMCKLCLALAHPPCEIWQLIARSSSHTIHHGWLGSWVRNGSLSAPLFRQCRRLAGSRSEGSVHDELVHSCWLHFACLGCCCWWKCRRAERCVHFTSWLKQYGDRIYRCK